MLGPNEEGVLKTGTWKFLFLTDDYDANLEEISFSSKVSKTILQETINYYEELILNNEVLPELINKTVAGYKVITNNRKKHFEYNDSPFIRIYHMSQLYYKNKTNFYDVNIISDVKNNEVFLSIINVSPQPPKKWYKKHRDKVKRKVNKMKKKIYQNIAKLNEPIYIATYNWSLRLFKEKPNRILFTSDSREKLGGNLEFVYHRLIERGLDKNFELRTLFKESIKSKRKLKDKLLFPYLLATSKTILLDDYHPMLYKINLSKSKKIVQLWHASGPFKTVGFSRLGKPGGPALMSKTHRIYTHAIVSSEYAVPFYAEAFSMPTEAVIPTGIPRVDPFFSASYKEEIIQKLHKEFPAVEKAKKVILFSPTFRGYGPSNANYPFNTMVDLEKMAQYAYENNAIFLIKLHPFIIKNINIPEEYQDVLIDVFNYREINDLLFVTDLLITDYSSVVFEYSIFEKPMIFYAYDLEEYIASRDFYVEFEQFVPGKIVKTFDELMYSIKTNDFEQEKIIDFKNLYFKYQDTNSTDRVIDQIILEKESSDNYVFNGTPS